ncbi:MAG: hypothetical protein ACJ72D_01320 [Marmoricola sp.]
MSSREEEARRAREDADWQALVDSYGERPEFPEPRTAPAPETPPVELPPELAYADDEDGYVPPPPPPLQRPHGLRALAWFGLFGVPAVVLLCIMVDISLPSVLSLLFLAWFVGGFGYLVATMNGPKDPDAGWDDGAVL